ncbi:type I restriction endonuclease subunit R [Belliella kenyensis]|uniref:Type I restriction enzyme endonuclease subunit n=1 Tax=Belliella kenyensis TaxID=1472724 RepID=A0ABV8EM87_9BACT|nr:type I restriction endonuclease subunit R [Belliella kenyensis]MCH7401206.1 type I restriction endonuclease subunit R [Belliella kenyensis]MDN3602652.1 type I restriction endonuclease subunit R [Belliella kenyensis]
MKPITEDKIETFAIEVLQSLGWEYVHGLMLAPGAEQAERENFEQIVLVERLRKSVAVLNSTIPQDAQEQAIQKVLRIYSPELLHNNESFHQLLIEKVKIPYQQDGFERSYEVALIDFENPLNNEFLCINQYTIVENNQNKRPDVLLFVNGLPLVVIELKNAADENATMRKAFDQIQTYKATIPSLFTYNAICVISDGMECKAGSVSAGFSRFMTWKSYDGKKEASRFIPQLEILLKGMLNPATLLDLVRNFIVFEKSKREDPKTGITQIETVKKLAAYHQYYAVNRAVQSSIIASGTNGDKRGGVVWHTQGSGKSLSMVFYSGKLITAPEMQNPTILVITDRNDLDDQLFDTFANSKQLLRQEPVQAKDREHLKELLKVASGGIVFATIQKFLPARSAGGPEDQKSVYEQLSERRNIVVIADEAHRTQYGFEASIKEVKDKETKEKIGERIAYGFAKYMRDALPNATYIGFTGTPIEGRDVNTPQVFGQYVDVYDISQAVADGATVRIYYESRLAKVNLDEEGKRLIEEFDAELEQDEEITDQQKAKAKYTKLEAIVGNEERIKNLAKDIVNHSEQRQKVFDGKGMIVAMSRRIAANLYKEIIALRPEWHNDDLSKGVIKVVMTSTSADGPEMQRHNTTKQQRKNLAERMKDSADPLRLVIVRDMWLTGFDAPCLHTLYIDKPMRGHNLMQAIARVNRVFKDKPGGLVVDYLGIATDLKKALSFYSDAGGKGDPTLDLEKAIELMNEKYEVVQQFFNEEAKTQKDIVAEEPEAYYANSFKFNYKRFFNVEPKEKMSIILQSEEHILGLDDGKTRFIREVTLLSQAFALSIPHPRAMEIKDDIAFFQAVKARLVKFEGTGTGKSDIEIETAIKQIVDEAISSDKVMDIFEAAGMEKPDISILSDEFLLEVKGMKHQNLALELLKKLLNDEIKTRSKTNLVKSKKLLEMLEGAIKRYQNNILTTAEIIQELINIAKEIKEADKEGDRLGLTKDEVAFYNALEVNDSAVMVLGDDQLREIAREITEKVKANATIDWTIRESARARLMVIVKRTLTKWGYPPDKQVKAIETVLKQAELMADLFTKD